MLNLFGGKKKQSAAAPPPVTNAGHSTASPEAQLQVVKQKVENLEKRQLFLQKKVQAQVQMAKEKSKAGDKRGAIFALKTKKMYEKQMEVLDNTLLTLQNQIMMIETASVNKDAISGMQAGKDALTNINKGIDLDKVAELKDDIQQSMDDMNELSDLLSTPVGAADMDDADLLNELEDFEANELDSALDEDLKSLPAPKKASKVTTDLDDLPAVPTTKAKAQPVAAANDDEEALAGLMAEMAS